MASLFNPATLYGLLVVAAAALREAARLRTVIELLVNSLDPKAIDGQDEAIKDLLRSDTVSGTLTTDYMLVLATQLNVEAERIAVRSPAVRRLRAKLDPGFASRHAPSAFCDTTLGDVSRETLPVLRDELGGEGESSERKTDPGGYQP